jgi:hypothetical protein
MAKKSVSMQKDLQVLERFLGLPVGSTSEVFEIFSELPNAIVRGESPEKFLYIEGSRKNKVLLVAHADTVWTIKKNGDIIDTRKEIIREGMFIRNESGPLGVDDRAGCAIVWLLKDLGHSLLITDGEEVGRIGSYFLVNQNKDIFDRINNIHQFIIEFDRRNGKDFKCYKNAGTEEFRKYLSEKTNYKEPDTVGFTDIVNLCSKLCGVNLSIGFYNEHSEDDYINIEEWLHTLNLCRNWLSEEKLPRFELK